MRAVADRERVEHIVVRRRRRVAEPRFEEVLEKFRAERAIVVRPLRERIVRVRRVRKVRGIILEHDAVIGRGLYVRLPAHRVDAAARDANVAHEELDDGEAAQILHTDRVLRHAKRIHHNRRRNGGEQLRGFLNIRLGHPRDRRRLFERIALEMFCETIHDGVLCRHAARLHWLAVRIQLVAPSLFVISPCFFVVAGENAGVKFVIVAQKAEGVRVPPQIIGIVFFVLDDVVDDSAEEDDIRPRTELEEVIRNAGCACIADVDMDDDGAVVARLHNVLHRHWMALRHIRSFDPNHLGVL